MEARALRVCPKTQISIDIKVVTIPTAAKASVGFNLTFPTMAASVRDKIGSEIPEINAGMANLLICLRAILVLTRLIHNNKRDVRSVLENIHYPNVDNLFARKIFDSEDSLKRCPNAQKV